MGLEVRMLGDLWAIKSGGRLVKLSEGLESRPLPLVLDIGDFMYTLL